MSAINAERHQDIDTADFEGEIREFIRRDVNPRDVNPRDVAPREVAPPRRPQPETSEFAVTNINSLVQRVAGTSLQEIDNLVGELQTLRDFLLSEGERVQREIAGYGELSKATLRSTKIIAESMSQWKQSTDGRAT
jgi:hypothetical protein